MALPRQPGPPPLRPTRNPLPRFHAPPIHGRPPLPPRISSIASGRWALPFVVAPPAPPQLQWNVTPVLLATFSATTAFSLSFIPLSSGLTASFTARGTLVKTGYPVAATNLLARLTAAALAISPIVNMASTLIGSFSASGIVGASIEETTGGVKTSFTSSAVFFPTFFLPASLLRASFVAHETLSINVHEGQISSFLASETLTYIVVNFSAALRANFAAAATVFSSVSGVTLAMPLAFAALASAALKYAEPAAHLQGFFSATEVVGLKLSTSEHLLANFAAGEIPGFGVLHLTSNLSAIFSGHESVSLKIHGGLSASFHAGYQPANNASGIAPLPVPSGYTQAFLDEFTATSMDMSVWSGAYSGTSGGFENGQFGGANHLVYAGDSTVKLLGFYDPVTSQTLYNFWAGAGFGAWNIPLPVGSQVYVCFKTDLYENMASIALLIGATTWPPELDFAEITPETGTPTPVRMEFTPHYDINGSAVNWPGQVDSIVTFPDGIDFTQWHVYGQQWGADTITATLDGIVWASIANPSAPDESSGHGLNGPQEQVLCIQMQTGDPGTPALNTSIVKSNAITMTVDWAQAFIPA